MLYAFYCVTSCPCVNTIHKFNGKPDAELVKLAWLRFRNRTLSMKCIYSRIFFSNTDCLTDIEGISSHWIIDWVGYVISDKYKMNTTNTAIVNETSAVPWGQVVVFSITSVSMLTGNILVIIAVLRFRFLQTPANVFVVGLTCLDVMGIITLVLTLELVEPIWTNNRLPCLAKLTFGGVNVVSTAMMLAGTT